jgi:hypothetical protein
MKILMFAGPGCVGKTTQLELMVKKCEEEGKKVAFHKSSTRKTYAAMSIKNESEILINPVSNMKFQDRVFDDNAKDLLEALNKAIEDKVDLFIADRSPFDYIAYYFTVFQTYLTIEKINLKRKAAWQVMREIGELCPSTQIVPFIYPVSWSKDTESSDGWRADKTGKNFIWGSVVTNEIELFKSGHQEIPQVSDAATFTNYLYQYVFPKEKQE